MKKNIFILILFFASFGSIVLPAAAPRANPEAAQKYSGVTLCFKNQARLDLFKKEYTNNQWAESPIIGELALSITLLFPEDLTQHSFMDFLYFLSPKCQPIYDEMEFLLYEDMDTLELRRNHFVAN